MDIETHGTRTIKVGEVKNLRELRAGIQAHVCIGADSEHGTAIVVVTSNSPAVQAAVAELKRVMGEEAKALTAAIHQGQLKWESAS
jgi:hypothetical protein